MKKLRNDIFLISSIIVICLIGLIIWLCNRTTGTKAYIYSGEYLIKEVDLSENQTFTVEGKISEMTIVVQDGKIKVLESGCLNQDCVNKGFVQYDQEWITCLPNEVYIRVVEVQ